MGLPRKKNYAGRWDVLIEKSTRCLNRLFDYACKKKRNYILDQVFMMFFKIRNEKLVGVLSSVFVLKPVMALKSLYIILVTK